MRRARTGRRAGAGAVVAAAGVLLAGGCGVHESEVVEAGGAATVQAFGGRESLIFFVSPDGRLSPVFLTPEAWTYIGPDGTTSSSRREDPSSVESEAVRTDKLVAMLLRGPRGEDRAVGLTTALPPLQSHETVQVETPADDGPVRADLPIALRGLNRTALRQLICTIAYSQDRDGRVTVRLRGQDGESRSGTCDLDPDS